MKRLFIFLAISVLLSACANYHYDTELQERIETQGKQATEEWFAKYIPQASNLTIKTQYREGLDYITNITEGEFTLNNDSAKYSYVFNWESDSCLISNINGKDDSKPVETTLYGKTISNQESFPFTRKTEETTSVFSEVYPMELYSTEGEANMQLGSSPIDQLTAMILEGLDEETTLHQLVQQNDSTFIAIFNKWQVYDPNANIINGFFGVDSEMKTISYQEIEEFMITNNDGEVSLFGHNRAYSIFDAEGSLGESARIWSSLEAKQVVYTLSRPGANLRLVDVDNDGIFELLAFNVVTESELSDQIENISTFLFTLADENGNIDGVKHLHLALSFPDSYHPMQLDLKHHQAFWRGGTGNANIGETCVDIVNSHASTTYEYVKEVNPENTDEYEESFCKMAKPNSSDVINITSKEYKEHCTHSKIIYAIKAADTI